MLQAPLGSRFIKNVLILIVTFFAAFFQCHFYSSFFFVLSFLLEFVRTSRLEILFSYVMYFFSFPFRPFLGGLLRYVLIVHFV